MVWRFIFIWKLWSIRSFCKKAFLKLLNVSFMTQDSLPLNSIAIRRMRASLFKKSFFPSCQFMQSPSLQLEEITHPLSEKENNFPFPSAWKLEFCKAYGSTASHRLSGEGSFLDTALLHVFAHPVCFPCQHNLLPCPPLPYEHANYTLTRWHSLACEVLKVGSDAYNNLPWKYMVKLLCLLLLISLFSFVFAVLVLATGVYHIL